MRTKSFPQDEAFGEDAPDTFIDLYNFLREIGGDAHANTQIRDIMRSLEEASGRGSPHMWGTLGESRWPGVRDRLGQMQEGDTARNVLEGAGVPPENSADLITYLKGIPGAINRPPR